MTSVHAAPSTVRRRRWYGMVGRDLAAFGALALLSLLVGIGVNCLQHPPLPLWHRLPAHPPDEVGLDKFQAFALRHEGVVIDARSSLFYRAGHVPGALNIPRGDFPVEYQRAAPQLGVHKTDAIAIYCSGVDCHDANFVADALAMLGYEKLLVYREGWEEWSQSGLPQEK